MITKLRISEPEQTIYFEVGKEGLYHVTARNSDGTLIFEKLCWKLIPDIQYTIITKKIDSPEIIINPFCPDILSSIDYKSNKLYLSCEQNIELRINLYDTFNNRRIWKTQHEFDSRRIWFSPPEKLVKYGSLLLIVKDIFENVIYTKKIINDQYIFCHIPKTAGTSIKKALNLKVFGNGKSHGIELSHFIFDRKNSNCFSFAFVRNPYKRFLSAYFFLVGGGLGLKQQVEKDKFIGNSDIDEFIKTKLKNSLEQEHLTPQHHFIPDGVDYLGKVENMQEDFNEICKVIGLDPIQLPYENRTPKYEYELTNEQKDIIYEIYKEDFIRFGYEK